MVEDREKKLEVIQSVVYEDFKRRYPQYADEFDIKRRVVQKRFYAGRKLTGTSGEDDPDHYEFMLVPKSNPQASQMIMQMYPEDVRRRVKVEDRSRAYGIPASDRYMQEAISRLLAEKKKESPGREEDEGGLEGSLGLVTISLFVLSILFTSSKFTGFAISNATQTTSNIAGIGLFLLGLAGVFVYFRMKNTSY